MMSVVFSVLYEEGNAMRVLRLHTSYVRRFSAHPSALWLCMHMQTSGGDAYLLYSYLGSCYSVFATVSIVSRARVWRVRLHSATAANPCPETGRFAGHAGRRTSPPPLSPTPGTCPRIASRQSSYGSAGAGRGGGQGLKLGSGLPGHRLYVITVRCLRLQYVKV